MPFMITAHSTKPGQQELYEKFLQERKLWFVRNLPGIISYRVFRTEERFDPSGEAPKDIRYDVIAIIEYAGDVASISALYTSDKWQDFMNEYIHVLDADAPMYLAHEISQLAELSRQEFRQGACQCPEK